MKPNSYCLIDLPAGGSRRLYAETSGSGAPSIVIEVGSTMAGTRDPGWMAIHDALEREHTVLMYDRANLGQSGAAPLPRSLDDFANDLRGVLLASEVPAPYVLIGCSLGGMIVTHYASVYPESVRGLLLLDAPHPDMNEGTLALLPPERGDEPVSLAEFRQLAWQEQVHPQEALDSEGLDYPGSQVLARSWSLGDIPLVVLTAGINEYGEGFPPEVIRAYEDLWLEQQRTLALLSTRSAHQVLAGCDHIIHACRPDVVLESVRWLLSQ
jgi:pimeloyl-ACP methyl ester carboxylesterase